VNSNTVCQAYAQNIDRKNECNQPKKVNVWKPMQLSQRGKINNGNPARKNQYVYEQSTATSEKPTSKN